MNRKQGFFRILAGVLLAVLLLVPGSRAVSASGGATGAKPAQGNLQCAVQLVESTPETTEKIMNREDVAFLAQFLTGKSLTIRIGSITASELACSDNSRSVRFFIIPFVQEDTGEVAAHKY